MPCPVCHRASEGSVFPPCDSLCNIEYCSAAHQSLDTDNPRHTGICLSLVQHVQEAYRVVNRILLEYPVSIVKANVDIASTVDGPFPTVNILNFFTSTPIPRSHLQNLCSLAPSGLNLYHTFLPALNYLNARQSICNILQKINTPQALQILHDHVIELHYYIWDVSVLQTYTVRYLLSTDRDLQCWSYLKAWIERSQPEALAVLLDNDKHGWHKEGILDMPPKYHEDLLDLKLNVEYVKRQTDIGFWIFYLLLLFRWYNDLLALQDTLLFKDFLSNKMNEDVADVIVQFSVSTQFLKCNRRLQRSDNAALLQRIKKRMMVLWEVVYISDKDFWISSVGPEREAWFMACGYLANRGKYFTFDSNSFFWYCWSAWRRERGGIEWIVEGLEERQRVEKRREEEIEGRGSFGSEVL
ncbi:hypothetical protein TWF694_008216 [Orbilia ellipsospora]|uniref:MYND-type zinc finger protein samB n=1 Tax=Orbilia ellipsospora TaxID=2528407 RepID=A0AAV9XM36_9PEZI